MQPIRPLHPRSRLLPFVAAAAATLAAISGGVRAQDAAYPSRTVQIVVPYSTGTTGDILARLLGPRLAERWKVAVVTDNRPGATGAIGLASVAKAAPDGHTLAFVVTSYSMIPAIYKTLPFDPAKSFAPVTQITTSGLALVVHPQIPAAGVRELVQLARRRPGELFYASAQHLAMELLKLETGVNIVHIPHKTLSGALTDLMGGHVQVTISTLQTIQPFVSAGRLRMLAATGAARSPAFPNVPTLKEQGFALDVESWSGALAPAGTPAAVITRLNADIVALLQQPEIRDMLARQGMNAVGGPPERFGELLKSELTRWARVVAAAKIKFD
jgi:tripartite-type tricarboxylate transporter receptor subunit TctC